MVYHTDPECGSLAEVSATHLVFIGRILLEEGECGGILLYKVEDLATTGLDEIKEGHRVVDLNILINESFNLQPLHSFTDCFETE